MKYKVDRIFVLYRNGNPFRHFTVETQAKHYFCAARELCPDEHWEIRFVEVQENE